MLKEFLVGVSVLAVAGTSVAQTAATPEALCPSGDLITVRFSELTPNGTVAGFTEAASQNQKYYRDRNIKGNYQLVGQVLVRDPATNTWSVSPKEVSTAHVNPQLRGGNSEDPDWKAFVAQYNANSKIVTQKMVCYTPAIDETAAITSEILSLEQTWAEKFVAGDDAAIAALLDDSFVSYGQNKPENKAEFLAAFPEPSKRPATVGLSGLTVRVERGHAFAQGVWTETSRDGKVRTLSFLDVWRQERDGAWKAIMSQTGELRP
jgi:hypothetical protein